ncbi:PKD domain-containing protein (plasmid) [Haloferax mediterranei ATCC 33500]|uniref:Chitinase n=1 Tax=Haloferax mediterranei (strain ATCC 33500 / DSM 1411 / JCM 8866 / NBRC 14739 / NCIMB 2177 / R-4) TaxID=523841 RepID=I3R9G4_HALMT|nr:PKD domain-containing protein [Haloferax mediterranei]AFK20874.1 chitinase [Haloferax mediterranei ATCC 33500]AHZ24257.1 chitinase [Haloferax mediterranei ATCC 33500]EMA05336.1 chitinase / lysozyme [Haloferax mediterranei ATCC 33500]MDX5989862.1 PKD domain-containing protein [Haloferax mediterranei ATCC 33500]QCQ77303.1 PKD domain-containing protein [Haloferax mediterranei ATCC 33500]
MKQNRRSILRSIAGLTGVAGLSTAGIQSVKAAGDYPQWDPDTVYTDGDRVVHDAHIWEAKWWTKGDEPSADANMWKGIEPADNAGDPPTAAFDVSATFVQPGTEVTCDASASTGDLSSYEWDFGDGTTGTGLTTAHAYDATGDYTISLTVTDADGNTADATRNLTVDADGVPSANPIPDSVFAPYVDMMLEDQLSLAANVEAAGTKYFTLAFVLADGNGDPAWAGSQKVGEPSNWLDVGTQLTELRDQHGGEVIVSFGGLNGTYLAEATTSASELKDAYATVVDTYDLTYIDFDEESLISRDEESIRRRNEALVMLQDEYPDLHVSYTLPVMPSGLPGHSSNDVLFVLEDAVSKGVELDAVNLMVMDYGADIEPNAENAISAAESVHKQLGDLYPNKSASERWSMLGLTPMIGVNDIGGTFYQEDARQVLDFAQNHDLRLLSFWELVRDNGKGDKLYESTLIEQEPFEFSSLFNPFTTNQ